MNATSPRRFLPGTGQAIFLLAVAALVVGPAAAQGSPGSGTSSVQGSSSGQSTSGSYDHTAEQGSSASPGAEAKKPGDPGTTKIKIIVTNSSGKAVENASVYIRFPESGGFLRKDKLAELDLKTNQDGTVKVPEIPQGKILIQIYAKGWRTFGKWYDIETEQQTVEIKLDPPPRWY
jgi:hypothetical protein